MTVSVFICFALVVTAFLLQERKIKRLTEKVDSLIESRNKYVTKHTIDLVELSISLIKQDVMQDVKAEMKSELENFDCRCDTDRWLDSIYNPGCDCEGDIDSLDREIYAMDRVVRDIRDMMDRNEMAMRT